MAASLIGQAHAETININDTIAIEDSVKRALNSHNQQQIDDYKSQLETAQRELDDLHAKHPEWQDEINKIVQGFNRDGPEATEQAFEDLDHLIGQSRVKLNQA